ncbi:helix-turn-helix transcriptional regulator [Aeromicrobium endophyticum]|nr:LuxR C-terminal-related transcriptional regulator [Aeromicrobium endophyticum]
MAAGPRNVSLVSTPSADVLERAERLVGLLKDLVRCDAIALSAVNPFEADPHHELLAADGYPAAPLRALLSDFVPESDNPGFRVTRNEVRTGLRWSDLARDWDVHFEATSVAERYLLPAGFHEGLSACLWLPDGTHVGAIHMNWENARSATDERRQITERFLPLVAEVSNVLQSHRVVADEVHGDAHVALLVASGLDHHVPGRDVGPVLRADGTLWPRLVASRGDLRGRYLWMEPGGTCHSIELTGCAGGVVLVAEREVPPPYGLSARELEVVTLLATGASNPEIAHTLVVSRRTVSTHVEHVLGKLGVPSRAGVAARAIREGLLLL